MIATSRVTSDRPMTHKIFEASTAHITKRDSELLKTDELPICAYEYEYGWFVFTGHDSEEEELTEAIRKYGLSDAFIALRARAKSAGCKFLQLDCDAMVYDDLPKFEW